MNTPLRSILWSAALILPPASLSGEVTGSVEERLKLLEQQIENLARENATMRKQLGWQAELAPVLPQPGGNETKLSVGGFLQGQGEFGRAADPRWNGVRDRLLFRRARIYLAGSFAENFEFKAELDLQGNTLSAGTGKNARANEIFINWRKFDFANLRFGQLKPAYGAEALASDTKTLTIERSLSNDRLTDPRQLAVAAAGCLFDKKVGYYVVVANGTGPNVSANDNGKFQKSARATITPFSTSNETLTLGVDGLWTEDVNLTQYDFGLVDNLFTGRREMRGIDVQWTHGRLDLSGEWLRGTFQPENAAPAAKFKAEGWHVTAAYFLVPSKLQAVIRREEFDPNTLRSDNIIRTTLFGLNYLVKGDDIKLMVNYLEGRVPDSAAGGGRLLTRLQIIY